MCPKKSACDGGEEKRKTTRATLGVKKEIIEEHENGAQVSDLASKYVMPKSTTSTFFDEYGYDKSYQCCKRI